MAYDFTLTLATGHSSLTHYGTITRRADGQMWNGTTEALATDPTYAQAALTTGVLTEINGSGKFGVTLPAGLPSGQYDFDIRLRAGGTAVVGDNVLKSIRFQKSGNSIFLE